MIFEQGGAEQGVSDHPLKVGGCRSLWIIGVSDAERSHGIRVAAEVGLHRGVVALRPTGLCFTARVGQLDRQTIDQFAAVAIAEQPAYYYGIGSEVSADIYMQDVERAQAAAKARCTPSG